MHYEARDTTLGDTLGFMVTNTNQLVTLFSWLGSPLNSTAGSPQAGTDWLIWDSEKSADFICGGVWGCGRRGKRHGRQ